MLKNHRNTVERIYCSVGLASTMSALGIFLDGIKIIAMMRGSLFSWCSLKVCVLCVVFAYFGHTFSFSVSLTHANTHKPHCLLVGCLTSQQQGSVSQEQICPDKLMCCHTEIEVADPTFYLTQSQYTDYGPTSPCADPNNARRLAGWPLECQFWSHWYNSTQKNPYSTSWNWTPDLPLSRQMP